jgi:hypothetical protein
VASILARNQSVTVAALLCLVACTRQPDNVVADLLALFPVTEDVQRVDQIDLGE